MGGRKWKKGRKQEVRKYEYVIEIQSLRNIDEKRGKENRECKERSNKRTGQDRTVQYRTGQDKTQLTTRAYLTG